MPVRRVALRLMSALALAAAPALAACGGGQHTQRRPGAAGKIEALREAQEKAEHGIEVEGERRARELEREREATRVEAEREADDRAGKTH
jgi:hypothetical protein